MSDVDEFLSAIPDEKRRGQAKQLDQLFRKVTGFNPQMWSGKLVGYGSFDYTYESGRSGTFLATGFAVQKAKFSIHILPGYTNLTHFTDRLGKAKFGQSCTYVNKLEDIDLDVLAELIRAGLKDLNTHWPVQPT